MVAVPKRMRGHRVVMSSAKTGGSDDWETPKCVLKRVAEVGPIGLDPCAPVGRNPVGANRTFDENSNGLNQSWFHECPPGEIVFVNPPYSNVRSWLRLCNIGLCEVIALVPARTDTRAWHEIKPKVVAFWRGRLQFKGATGSAPFPSALLYWGPRPCRFGAAFEDVAKVVMW